jgi:molecular chaperone GrpE
MSNKQHANGDEKRTRAEERIAALDTSPSKLLAELDELRGQLETVEQESAENKAGWQRTAADYANYRRRTEQDREASLGLANEALLIKLLVIVDDFDRAIANKPDELAKSPWVDGIVAIDRKLRQLLDSEGLTPIEAAGQPFDPHQHEAIVQVETNKVPEGTVTEELQRGYRLRDRVLRPSLVAVAKSPTKEQ